MDHSNLLQLIAWASGMLTGLIYGAVILDTVNHARAKRATINRRLGL